MTLTPEQARKVSEARAESERHTRYNAAGQVSKSNEKPALANEDSARVKETNSYDADEIDNSGAVGGGV
jgi:hypothetical protein